MQQFVFIRCRKYYSLTDLEEGILQYNWPPGTKLPKFGKYVIEGRVGTLPDYDGKAKFTAATARAWLEHGTTVMENIFKNKVRAS